uniref:Uncharacterized protein n=1 Tax=Calidris pygmaea TaxID=425635 RepID=A0A8C3K5K1_9CHAR
RLTLRGVTDPTCDTGGGGASGIGRAVCARLAREGARVAVADRDEVGAGDTVGGLHAAGGDTPSQPHAAFGVDVASAPSVTQLLTRVQEDTGDMGGRWGILGTSGDGD